MKKIFVILFKIILVCSFVFVGVLASGFFAVKFGWTDVAGEEDANSNEYNLQAEKNELMEELREQVESVLLVASSSVATSTQKSLPKSISLYGSREKENWCKIAKTVEFNDLVATKIYKAYEYSKSEALLNNMLLALKLRMVDKDEFTKILDKCIDTSIMIPKFQLEELLLDPKDENPYLWQNGEPWKIIKDAIANDQDVIARVAEETGVQPRMLVSVAIVEQLRLYYTQRELFEKVFKPLKILANATKMAWGVMAIKEKMAIETEDHLVNKNSPYYLGPDFAHLLDFDEDEDKAKVRYARLTDKTSHYYSYLYGALILKQLEKQWESAGHSINYRPEIQATLFNIGFRNSKPKDKPKVGGSTIEIEDDKYFFGSLAFEFYYSGEMEEIYPFK